MSGTTARGRLAQLFAKVDAFFANAEASLHGPDGITCARGCHDCCKRRFSVTSIEAEAVAEAIAELPSDRRAAIAARAPHGDDCALLDADGSCAVYAARPLICRTHGLPIRFQEQQGNRRLQMIDACPKNFVGRALEGLPTSAVLDQGTLSTILGALDAARAAEDGRALPPRIEIAALASGSGPALAKQ